MITRFSCTKLTDKKNCYAGRHQKMYYNVFNETTRKKSHEEKKGNFLQQFADFRLQDFIIKFFTPM